MSQINVSPTGTPQEGPTSSATTGGKSTIHPVPGTRRSVSRTPTPTEQEQRTDTVRNLFMPAPQKSATAFPHSIHREELEDQERQYEDQEIQNIFEGKGEQLEDEVAETAAVESPTASTSSAPVPQTQARVSTTMVPSTPLQEARPNKQEEKEKNENTEVPTPATSTRMPSPPVSGSATPSSSALPQQAVSPPPPRAPYSSPAEGVVEQPNVAAAAPVHTQTPRATPDAEDVTKYLSPTTPHEPATPHVSPDV